MTQLFSYINILVTNAILIVSSCRTFLSGVLSKAFLENRSDLCCWRSLILTWTRWHDNGNLFYENKRLSIQLLILLPSHRCELACVTVSDCALFAWWTMEIIEWPFQMDRCRSSESTWNILPASGLKLRKFLSLRLVKYNK